MVTSRPKIMEIQKKQTPWFGPETFSGIFPPPHGASGYPLYLPVPNLIFPMLTGSNFAAKKKIYICIYIYIYYIIEGSLEV